MGLRLIAIGLLGLLSNEGKAGRTPCIFFRLAQIADGSVDAADPQPPVNSD